MAEIIPLRAWRYNKVLAHQIDSLTSPLFDVVSEQQREELYRNPINSIHISVPKENSQGRTAHDTLKTWKREKVIVQDPLPGIYVYYQYFFIKGEEKQCCRKGFICNIRTYDWEEGVILRHENTIPSSVNDRIVLLEETELNVSPTHGLYSDVDFELERYMDESITQPLLETEDYQGVRDVISVIHDRKVIQKFIDKILNKEIILADGHHRYESSLAYKKKQQANNPFHTGNEGYNHHLMYLTNTESEDIKILPTHRLLKDIENFDEEVFVIKLEQYFHIQFMGTNPLRLASSIVGSKWMFGLIMKNFCYLIQLKEEAFEKMSWPFPDKIKALDLTILHYFVIEKIIGIPGKDQRKSDKIVFERNVEECASKVSVGKAQFAIVTNPVTMKEVKEVCYSGYTLPQKSTYFYPKVICGFLYSSINEDEFSTFNSCF